MNPGRERKKDEERNPYPYPYKQDKNGVVTSNLRVLNKLKSPSIDLSLNEVLVHMELRVGIH